VSLILDADPGKQEVLVRVVTDHPSAVSVTVTREMRGTRKVIRGGDRGAVVDGIWAQRDYEVLFNIPVTYDAVTYDAAGAALEHAVSPTVQVVYDQAYLRDVLVPSLRTPLRLVGTGSGDSSSEVRRELLRPMGRRTPVVLTDVRSSGSGTSEVLTVTAQEESLLRKMFDSGRVLILTGPADFDVMWPLYVSIGDVQVSHPGAAHSPARVFTFDWVEVDPPPPGLYDPLNAVTWQNLVEARTLWNDIAATPWIDVMYPVRRHLVRWGA
jgi:hypothetical protein